MANTTGQTYTLKDFLWTIMQERAEHNGHTFQVVALNNGTTALVCSCGTRLLESK